VTLSATAPAPSAGSAGIAEEPPRHVGHDHQAPASFLLAHPAEASFSAPVPP
jgi:hypothetical protein